jgi:hypothetical protein
LALYLILLQLLADTIRREIKDDIAQHAHASRWNLRLRPIAFAP